MKPIYEPSGKAKEYGDLAINIYTGCPHRCYYCFAPNVLHKQKELFHGCVEPRKNIVEEVKKQLAKEQIKGKLIHLCFTCDPYPTGYDTTPTREIIEAIKESGNNVQILTKNGVDAMQDFDLLDENDWFGITYCGYPEGTLFDAPSTEPGTGPLLGRLQALKIAKNKGIKTWISCEPVMDEQDILSLIMLADYIDLWKIGKMNYHKSDINWGEFGKKVERELRIYHRNYYIKDSLRAEMEKDRRN